MEKKINSTKKMEIKKEIILIIMGIFLISLVSASGHPGSIPPLPDHFYGNITLYGQSAPIGTLIEIYVGGIVEKNYNITQIGKYDLYVKTGETGELIEFKVNNKLARTSTRQGGKSTYLDLSVIKIISPPSGTSGGGGGSSGGGGGSIASPSSSSNSENTLPVNNSENNKTNIKKENKTKEQKNTGFGITGGVIGTLNSGKTIIAVVFLIILGIGVVLIKFKPLQKWTKKFS